MSPITETLAKCAVTFVSAIIGTIGGLAITRGGRQDLADIVRDYLRRRMARRAWPQRLP